MLLKEIEKEAVSNEAASFSINNPKKNQGLLWGRTAAKIHRKESTLPLLAPSQSLSASRKKMLHKP